MLNPILPNRADDKTIRNYLLERGKLSLQMMAGFQPPQIPDMNYLVTLPPLPMNIRTWAKSLMHEMCDPCKADYNPRLPFLVLVWMWLGTNNPYYLLQRDKYLQSHHLTVLIHLYRILLLPIKEADGALLTQVESAQWQNHPRKLLGVLSRYFAQEKFRESDQESLFEFADIFNATYSDIERRLVQQSLAWKNLSDEGILEEIVPMTWRLYDILREHHDD